MLAPSRGFTLLGFIVIIPQLPLVINIGTLLSVHTNRDLSAVAITAVSVDVLDLAFQKATNV